MTIPAAANGDVNAPKLPSFSVPAGTCDCHVHILDPARYPFQAERRYTPGPATVAQMQAMHARLGVERVVVVQNSVYGADNRCLLDALAQIGPAARGVATIGPDTTPYEIDALNRAGVRGARINLAVSKTTDPAIVSQALEVEQRLPQSWHVQINADLAALAAVAAHLSRMRRPPVLDHFAHAIAERGLDQPGLPEILDLMRARLVFVKLSGVYQVSKLPNHEDVQVIAQAFAAAAPDQVIWGSDWPHTGGTARSEEQRLDITEPFREENDPYNFELLGKWVSDPAARKQILVDTPERIYGYLSG